MTKPNVSTQAVSADKKGDGKPWPQNISVSSRPKQGVSAPPKGVQTHPPKSAPPLLKTPHSPDTIQHNTGPSNSKVHVPTQTSLNKPPGLSKPANQQAITRPAKVNGGPGGSLTSSGNSSSDESSGQGEQTKQAVFPTSSPQSPSPSFPDKQNQQHSSQAPEGGSNHTIPIAQKGVWPGGPVDVAAQGRVAPPLVAAALTRSTLNGFPDEQQGRESPYLIPQLPRDPSSQPEDDWPALNPADSRMLAFMPPRGMSPLNIPTDPALVAVTSASFNRQIPIQFPPFGPFTQAMFLSDATRSNRDIAPSFPESPNFTGSPGFQERSAKFPNNAQGNPSFVVHRTPSGNLPATRAQPHSDPPKSVSSPNVKSPQPSFSNPADLQASRKERSPEPSKVSPVQPRIAANLQPPHPKLRTTFTQTRPPPEKTDSGTQIESLGVTTYTQTPDKSFVDVGVEVSVATRPVSVQASPMMKSSEAQTSTKVTLPVELEPPSLEEESSPADKIKFGIQYAIQVSYLCLSYSCIEYQAYTHLYIPLYVC